MQPTDILQRVTNRATADYPQLLQIAKALVSIALQLGDRVESLEREVCRLQSSISYGEKQNTRAAETIREAYELIRNINTRVMDVNEQLIARDRQIIILQALLQHVQTQLPELMEDPDDMPF